MNILNSSIEQVVSFMPTLMAGFFVTFMGYVLAMVTVWLTVRLCIALRLDRVLHNFGLDAIAGKADVRHTAYRALGITFALPVFLVFLNNAFIIWKLTVLSEFIHDAVYFLPRLLAAALVAGAGSLLSKLVSRSLELILLREGVQRAALISEGTRWGLNVFFWAMALTVLDIARPIVLIAFGTFCAAVGLSCVVAFGWGSVGAVERAWRSLSPKE